MLWMYIVLSVMVALASGVVALGLRKRDKTGPYIGEWNNRELPFSLILDSGSYDRDVKIASKKAIAFWNAANPGLWRALDDIGNGPIIPIKGLGKGECLGAGVVATTRVLFREGKIEGASIRVNLLMAQSVGPNSAWLAIAHEMGHVMGLVHDNQQGSIMFGSLQDGKPWVDEVALEELVMRNGKYIDNNTVKLKVVDGGAN